MKIKKLKNYFLNIYKNKIHSRILQLKNKKMELLIFSKITIEKIQKNQKNKMINKLINK